MCNFPPELVVETGEWQGEVRGPVRGWARSQASGFGFGLPLSEGHPRNILAEVGGAAGEQKWICCGSQGRETVASQVMPGVPRLRPSCSFHFFFFSQCSWPETACLSTTAAVTPSTQRWPTEERNVISGPKRHLWSFVVLESTGPAVIPVESCCDGERVCTGKAKRAQRLQIRNKPGHRSHSGLPSGIKGRTHAGL